MAEGILAVTVFCLFGLGFYIANKADQFLGEIQENAEEKQHSSKIFFLNTLSDEELLREIHECKRLKCLRISKGRRFKRDQIPWNAVKA